MGAEGERTWIAWSALSARREFSEAGPRSISFEAIWCYIDLVLKNLDEDEVEDLLYFLQVLDDKYLELEIKRLERSRKNKTPKGRSRG